MGMQNIFIEDLGTKFITESWKNLSFPVHVLLAHLIIM